MKRVITFILIAVSVILYAGCTDFSEDIKNLQAQIDALKSERINTIDEQVSSIKSSLSNLQGVDKDLQTYIDGLKSQLEALTQTEKDLSEKIEQLKKNSNDNKETLSQLEEYKSLVTEQISSLKSTIETLQAKDKDLQSQIEKLQDYIDSGIKDTKDWVSATFSTLDQYNATASIIASIQTQIETINSDISLLKNVTSNVSKKDLDKAIASSESAIKDWVNSLLEGYYTAEQTDAKIAALKEELGKSGNVDAESLTKDYEAKLTEAKKEMTEAYNAAISKAINDYNGTIPTKVALQLSTINGKISALQSEITALEKRVASLEERVSRIEELLKIVDDDKEEDAILSGETVIDGLTWMNYNIGATESNENGDIYTYDEALTVCPEGYRLPTIGEFDSLTANHSDWTTYNGRNGYWFSGSQIYSATASAIFLPDSEYWSATEKDEDFVYYQGFDSSYTYIETKILDPKKYYSCCYVRCVKGDISQDDDIAVDDYTKAKNATVAEVIRATNRSKYYKLTGTVSNYSNTHCTFDLTDDTGSIFVYSVDNKAEWIDVLSNGGKVTLVGKYAYYAAKSQPEVVNAHILEFEAGEEDDPISKPTYAAPVSIEEFIEKEVNDTDWYEITGVITRLVDVRYGRLYIQDGTGQLYIDGLTKEWTGEENDQSFSQIGLKTGYEVTLWTHRDDYSGTAQAGGINGPAFYISHKEGVIADNTGTVTLTFPDDNYANNAVNSYADTWTAKLGNCEFSIENFNNYEWTSWTYIKCGRKSTASVAKITNTTALKAQISKVVLTADAYDNSSMNSLVMNVYSDSALGTKVCTVDVTESAAAGEIEFAIPSAYQAKGLFYEIVFDCKTSSARKNGFIQISKVAYIAAE